MELEFLILNFVLCALGSRDKGEQNMARAVLTRYSTRVNEMEDEAGAL